MTNFQHIGVAGAGAWGVALANAAASAGRDVTLWGRDEVAMKELQRTRLCRRPLGVMLSDRVRATSNLSDLGTADAILLAIPAQSIREMAAKIVSASSNPRPLVICAKGIELGTHLFMSEVVEQSAPGWPIAILSGPSFAEDVAAGLPTAVTLAAGDERLAVVISTALKGPNLRLYHASDVRGVELGGASKNVLAIACGVAAGLELGPSAGAALIARGFSELRRFGDAFGARAQTLMGLSGLGDLVLTCSSARSRNFAFGLALGQGRSLAEASGGKLAEGATTALALMGLARARGVDMPIAGAVEALLKGEIDARAAVVGLLARPQKGEG